MTSTTTWRQRYEALRQLAFEGMRVLEAQPLGSVLLLRQGVAGWMRSWPQPHERPAPPPLAPLTLPPPVFQQQLTDVLVQMSLAHAIP